MVVLPVPPLVPPKPSFMPLSSAKSVMTISTTVIRLKGGRGRGTLEKEKPPIFGMIERGGQVVIRMLANVQQATLHPLIEKTVAKGSNVYTDEYTIYARLPGLGYGLRRGHD